MTVNCKLTAAGERSLSPVKGIWVGHQLCLGQPSWIFIIKSTSLFQNALSRVIPIRPHRTQVPHLNISCPSLPFIDIFTLSLYLQNMLKLASRVVTVRWKWVDSGTCHGSEYCSKCLGFDCLYPFPSLPWWQHPRFPLGKSPTPSGSDLTLFQGGALTHYSKPAKPTHPFPGTRVALEVSKSPNWTNKLKGNFPLSFQGEVLSCFN